MDDERGLEALRIDLEARRDALARAVARSRGDVAQLRPEEAARDVRDPGDDAVVREQEMLREAMAGRDAAELRAVEDALARLAAGEYGVCERCGDEIGTARLRARPYAIRCLRCQTLQEKQFGAQAPRGGEAP